ncbi:ATP-binding cassette sub-family A member 3 [Escovopsis weberi]|uniref:ATP-binding cassette sub-family A member 3 n=1 Tax=Escovopsis weberi TaxID=150374 RepID=A0A0M8MZH9_ESCWE|nr:ATP-binding cassette sub-family A member 3 [Escovopsis weberi]
MAQRNRRFYPLDLEHTWTRPPPVEGEDPPEPLPSYEEAFEQPLVTTFFVLIKTLTVKNFRVVVLRNPLRALCMALLAPVLLATVFSYVKRLFVPPAVYGFGHVYPVRNLAQAFDAASAAASGRHKVVLVDNGHTGGDIQAVLDELARQVTAAGPRIRVLRSRDESILATECRSTLRGVTSCFNAVVMMSSPGEGQGGIWNYSIRSDSEMWSSPLRSMVDRSDKNEEVYLLPFQRAIDAIITRRENPQFSHALAQNQELAFTSITQEEREAKVKRVFLNAIQRFMGVAFMLSIIWISFHLPGLVATERETGMSQLIDAMILTDRPWIPPVVRIISHYLSLSVIYAPAWIISSVVVHRGVFPMSGFAVSLAVFVLGGLGTTSFSMFLASFFSKAQLSGILSILAVALLGILAQAITDPSTATVIFLSAVFPPCSFVFFIILMSRFEKLGKPMSLLDLCPDKGWKIPGVLFLAFLTIQTLAYPVLAFLIERVLYSTESEYRKVFTRDRDLFHTHQCPVQLKAFTKIYSPGLMSAISSMFSKPREPVVAVKNLNLTVRHGQIVALLGANGSGKSTTLDAIAGLTKASDGRILVDARRGLGIAPQKNVLWNDLTVEEHLAVFCRLKSPKLSASQQGITETLIKVDLIQKRYAYASTLSGGQKRKLQLGMMLIGGSGVCCVDEVSSGVDPLSRRQLWDILLAERGERTMVITTHFLDEADLLADHIAIMSRGTLRAQGTSVGLKNRHGGGYVISVPLGKDSRMFPELQGTRRETSTTHLNFVAPTSFLAYRNIRQLKTAGITDYRFSCPTLENAFLKLSEEIQVFDPELPFSNDPIESEVNASVSQELAQLIAEGYRRLDDHKPLGMFLMSGRRLNFFEQAVILLKKRWTILRRNWILYLIALLLPILAAGLTSLYVLNTPVIGCSAADQSSVSEAQDAFTQMSKNFNPNDLIFPVGPRSKAGRIRRIRDTLPLLTTPELAPLVAVMLRNVQMIDSFHDFVGFTKSHSRNITTGLWLGDEGSNPTIAWVSNMAFASPLTAQQFLNLLLTNTTIQTTWTPLERPFNPRIGRALNLVVYMGLALAFYPAFFALYPSNERRKFVRSLQYSNGVRPFPLWIAYIVFDFTIVLVSSAFVVGLWAGLTNFQTHLEYVFVVLCLYGLASVLMAYLVSLFANSQLATFAWAVVVQETAFLCYLISYVGIITFLDASKIDTAILLCHFIVSAFMPIGSAVRALFLTTNLFSVACDGSQITQHPLEMTKFGGPIFLLIVQSCCLFGLLLWVDSGSAASMLRNLLGRYGEMENAVTNADAEMKEEATRVLSEEGSLDGLRLLNVTKSFGKNTVVDNVSFGIGKGEVFALLGPNGAGKSTTISLIRGDLKMSRGSGDIYVDNVSITKHLLAARASLGVCPQIDALDQMTVQEHLEFYARVHGIPNIEHNVNEILKGTGLALFSTRMASQLSGGNKRKLSLGIALMGNPTVVLLDEPSSGLDALAKRIMWHTFKSLVSGRSILLTTHSMEEADALAGRAGILNRRMLALGTLPELRSRFGDNLHVHLVSRSAPRTPQAAMERMRVKIREILPTATIEAKTYHGQFRFSVSEAELLKSNKRQFAGHGAMGRLIMIMEESKRRLGVEYYSIRQTTLDQVFLSVVGKHIQEEVPVEEQPHTRLWRVLEFIETRFDRLVKLFRRSGEADEGIALRELGRGGQAVS